ncbi:hypothetical protein PMAYCL1PPCAC_05342, partial [Pristionchus mayeri]
VMLMYDWVSCCLWLIEVLILSTGCLLSIPATKFLSADSILHVNFRLVFITIFVRNWLGTLARIAVIVPRVVFYGESRLPHQTIIIAIILFHSIQVGLSYMIISCERICSISLPNYENRCKSPGVKIALFIALVCGQA